MQILPLSNEFLAQAAALFIENYRRQRLITPLLPDQLEDRERVMNMLADAFDSTRGLAAVQDGQLRGYLCWYVADHFRGTHRKGAYVPGWGHACVEQKKARTYQALYRAAGARWAEAGCQVHAITLLAQDEAAEKIWYWNGFGLTVVDGIRAMRSLEVSDQTKFTIRKATTADAEALTQLDAEHWRHYSQSPIFMAAHKGNGVAENMEFLARAKNSIWLAEDKSELAGFLRFEGYDFDSTAILESEDGVMISGAYVRPRYRGQKVAAAMLDAALRDYAATGLNYCAVNFESFNPEAASFWMRYFEPVCYSLLRVPESI